MLTEKKYEMIPEFNLFRVKALRNFGLVTKGDIGGYIEKEDNLSHEGNCWVYDNAKVLHNARVYGNAVLHSNARVLHEAQVYGYAVLTDNVTVCDHAKIFGDANVGRDAVIRGKAAVYGFAQITGDAVIADKATVCDNAFVGGNAKIYDDTKVCSGAHISGDGCIVIKGNSLIEGTVRGSPQIIGAHVHPNVLITCGRLKGSSVVELLRCSLGVHPVNGVVRLFKRVRDSLRSEHDYSFIYPESGVVECPDYDPDPTVSCGEGLHFATNEYWPLDEGYKVLVADINLEDIICVLEGKARVKRATIVGVVSL